MVKVGKQNGYCLTLPNPSTIIPFLAGDTIDELWRVFRQPCYVAKCCLFLWDMWLNLWK
jgi:hypothetical protein